MLQQRVLRLQQGGTGGITDQWRIYQQIIDGLVAGMEAEYPELERGRAECEIADCQLEGEQAYFYYLDLLVRWQVLAVTRDGQVLIFEWQAEDQEFSQLQPVFEALTTRPLAAAVGK